MGEPRAAREERTGPRPEPGDEEAIAARIDRAVEERVRAHLAAHAHHLPSGTGSDRHGTRIVVAVASLLLALPLSAIAGGTAGAPGLALLWVGIVLVNLAAAWHGRR